jgi:hypothetical protein
VNGEFPAVPDLRDAQMEPWSAAVAFYDKARDEHWLRDKHDEGLVLILEDESMWEVHPSDRPITARWLRMSTIMVERTQKAEYPYLLKNTTEEETARADYLGEAGRVNIPPEVA